MHYDTLLQNATDIVTKCDSYFITKRNRSFFTTGADWDSRGCVITQTHSRAFQTLGRAFSFLLSPQKLGRVLQKLG